MPIYKVTAVRTQHVCTTVYAVDEDYLDDAIANVKHDDWELIRQIEVDQYAYCIDHDAVEES
jgi:hypothetical protein